MNNYNPKGLHRDHRGRLLDKWGRVMEPDWDEFEKRRRVPGKPLKYPQVLNPMHAVAKPVRTVESIVDTLLESRLEDQLMAKARTIKHCGDYGKLFYHPELKIVHWTAADSDGSPDYTDLDEVKRMLKLPGVKEVVIGDEWSPDKENGYQRLRYDR